MKKVRLDNLLVERGLVQSRARAQALIMAGKVYQKEQKITKSGTFVALDADIVVRGEDFPWVSRGGLKLVQALEKFKLPIKGAVCLDVGASTGGFTDVLLSYGAKHVYAVDVGRGQLAWKLRQDKRVTVLESTNARYLTTEQIPIPPKIVVCDASFIGLEKVLDAALKLAQKPAYVAALIKPQFQVERHEVGKGGVVRDKVLHDRVCQTVQAWLEDVGWSVKGIVPSPILGPAGNKEFLIVAFCDKQAQ